MQMSTTARARRAAVLATAAVLLAQPLAGQEPISGVQFIERPLVSGREGVVTSLHPLSSMAGMKILMQGGNAFDAAVATAVAATVVDPKDSSIGGQGFATIYDAGTGRVRTLNFFGRSPAGATFEAMQGREYRTGYLATPIPSNLRGYEALLEEYGTMTWAQILAPAIELADNGFIISSDLTETLIEKHNVIARFPETRRIFLREDGSAWEPGDLLVQRDLAETLKAIASEGPDVFYSGRIGREIADFYARNGGILSHADLAGYRPDWVTPIGTTYRGYTFYTQPPNSSAIALLLQLNLLEAYDLASMGHNSAEYLHLIGEVMRLAIADRNAFVGDPEHVSVPLDQLLSKEYAARQRSRIDPDRTIPFARQGEPRASQERENTTHLTVVDRDGNMVALTQTLGAWMGSGVVAGNTGVLMSNQMRHLHMDPSAPSRMGPGKRPRSNQSPTIVLREGRPFMALGTPGSDAIWQRMVQVIVNVIDFGMDIQAAITAPRMIYGGPQQQGTEIPPVFQIEDRIARDVIDALRARDFTLEVIPNDEGRLNGVMVDGATGMFLGGADPRALTYGVGW
jgi:gamma-glutamyltranspeptidase / glutathione hydrolase